MKKLFKNIIYTLLLVGISGFSQTTLDANDPSTFILGGGQESNTLTVNLLPIAIVDIEGYSASSESGLASLEAGLPFSGSTGNLENVWLNFTHRAANQLGRIFVSTNQPIPAGMEIFVEIEINNYGIAGDFHANPIAGQISLNETEQLIVDDFANGYTEDGLNNGYHLIYTIDNPSNISLPAGFEILYRIE